MARSPSQGIKSFIWLPRTASTFWKIYINSVDVTLDIFQANFIRAVCPETGQCSIDLINADQKYNTMFSQTQSIQLKIDFVNGTTTRFLGKIDSIKNQYQQDKGWVMTIEGGHITKDLYDIIVTEAYSATMSVQSILTTILAKYTSGYTLNFTASYGSNPNITWNAKTFWDCVADLCKLANADCYVDDDKTIYFFDKSSIENNNEAIVWDDTLVNLNGLGIQTVTTKNNVQVIGDDGQGLPVIATVQNTVSQATLGNKASVIFDNSISDTSTALTTANANLNVLSNPNNEGDAESLILPSLRPGDKIWISDPTQQIHGQYRVYSFKHVFPDERTFPTINQERTAKQILKQQSITNLQNQALTNPYQCTGSVNYRFILPTEIAAKDANVSVSPALVSLSSGTQGVFTTTLITTSTTVSYVHPQATGSVLSSILFELSTDGGKSYQTLTLNTLNTLSSAGTAIVMRVTLQSASSNLNSIAILYK